MGELILGINPRIMQSAYVILDDWNITHAETIPNDKLLDGLRTGTLFQQGQPSLIGIVEPEGWSTFEMVLWIGRALETLESQGYHVELIGWRAVKLHLCHSAEVKDTNVRQALIDLFGGERAVGGKKCPRCKGKGWYGRGRSVCQECTGSGWRIPPGPLYNLRSDMWSALAVAVTVREKRDR